MREAMDISLRLARREYPPDPRPTSGDDASPTVKGRQYDFAVCHLVERWPKSTN